VFALLANGKHEIAEQVPASFGAGFIRFASDCVVRGTRSIRHMLRPAEKVWRPAIMQISPVLICEICGF
jgi:hypothetical protein